MPQIAFGTGSKWKGQDVTDYVTNAIETGFSHIDTAQFYANEESVAAAIRETGLDRSDVPSSSLCPPSNDQPHCASIQPPPLPVLQSSNQGANRPRRRTPSIDPTPPAPSNHAARTHNARAVESRRTHKRQQAESVRAASVPRRLTHSAASRPLNRRILLTCTPRYLTVGHPASPVFCTPRPARSPTSRHLDDDPHPRQRPPATSASDRGRARGSSTSSQRDDVNAYRSHIVDATFWPTGPHHLRSRGPNIYHRPPASFNPLSRDDGPPRSCTSLTPLAPLAWHHRTHACITHPAYSWRTHVRARSTAEDESQITQDSLTTSTFKSLTRFPGLLPFPRLPPGHLASAAASLNGYYSPKIMTAAPPRT
ncbi:hypothetical protein POSPLADRAFT_1063046 [Postia placenta MAD-698-R-SB12]|uniref:NADP-dependent oxidoreductase domain-containing protein n=1 Tax=Postia placenta MAD-698-R-SB12 TaxID=670580 RepID=A0A1X6MHZ6_9APHY|nr:hypothetical protein POSPLADRAFT_1063046 [Postia placenta MAD-698-R-SB12]OSX56047.1 hypothetical protein POSPLADRAFT_1063046 [Postia placenta MAD-698-R-SB12]